jgi:hypothetical protein
MAEPNRSSSPKQFFDVAKPNKSRPSPTAKPVIVPNRPILQDPMVNAVPNSDEPTTAPPLVKLPTKIHIQPLASSAESTVVGEPVVVPSLTDDSNAPVAPASQSPISEHLDKARAEATKNPVPEAADTPEPVVIDDEPKPSAPAAEPAETAPGPLPKTGTGTAPISETPKDGALVTENDLADEEDALTEHDKAMQTLVAAKRYFLPINTQEKRRTKHFIILGVVLILLLVAAWANIALDAGLIHLNGVKPLTHLFSN